MTRNEAVRLLQVAEAERDQALRERDEARALCDDLMDELDPQWKDYAKEYSRACDIRRRWLDEGWAR